ncbi:30S ribosomal protein S8e [Candidatus Altiarchaeota archaeon]
MYHGKVTRANKKRKRFQGSPEADTQVGEDKKKKVKSWGGGSKLKLVKAMHANVVVDGKSVKCEVVNVADNPASRDLARRSIITKGAVIDVKLPDGKDLKAVVKSRPGQDGVLNAVKL